MNYEELVAKLDDLLTSELSLWSESKIDGDPADDFNLNLELSILYDRLNSLEWGANNPMAIKFVETIQTFVGSIPDWIIPPDHPRATSEV